MIRFSCGILLLLLGAAVLAETSATERYFQGLRERGLLDLAEGVLIRRLAAPDIPLAERAILTAELARTFGKHALFTQEKEQADLWRRAETLLSEFLAAHPNSLARHRFRTLQGELLLDRARAARWDAELRPGEPEARNEARHRLALAVTHLTALEPDLARDLRDKRRGSMTPAPLPSEAELHELLRRTQRLAGVAKLEQARLVASPERSELLHDAESWFNKAIDTGGTPEDLWSVQVALAEAARLAGKGEKARERLAEINTAALGNAARDVVAEVMSALLIDEGHPDRVVTFLIDYRRERGSLTGELRLLQIRGLAEAAALLDENHESEAARKLRDEIATVVNWTTAEHGGYWAYRARLAARQVTRQARYGPEMLEELRLARSEMDLGNAATAAKHFEQAAKLASDPSQAAELSFSQGRMLLKAGHFEEAARVLAAIPEMAPAFDQAAGAHLLSAWALGAWHDAAPSAARREAYVARLKEHRLRFPKSPTASRAALRLASVKEQRRQYSQALPPLREIVDDPTYGTVAAAAIARNHEKILAYLAQAEREARDPDLAAIRARQREEWAADARDELLALTESLRSSSNAGPLTMAQAELALRSAGILIDDPNSQAAAGALIDRVLAMSDLSHPPDEASFWNAIETSIRPLAVISLARRHMYQQSAGELSELAAAPLGDLLRAYRGMLAIETANGPYLASSTRFGITNAPIGPRPAELRDRLLTMLDERRATLSPGDVRQLDLALARAESQAGQSSQAAERFAKLVRSHPEDSQLLEQAAHALADTNDPELLRQARNYWREIERHHSPGSPAWLRARLEVIKASLALGEHAEARKLLTVTKLLHPGLGGAAMKAQFEAVAALLEERGGGLGETGDGENEP